MQYVATWSRLRCDGTFHIKKKWEARFGEKMWSKLVWLNGPTKRLFEVKILASNISLESPPQKLASQGVFHDIDSKNLYHHIHHCNKRLYDKSLLQTDINIDLFSFYFFILKNFSALEFPSNQPTGIEP